MTAEEYYSLSTTDAPHDLLQEWFNGTAIPNVAFIYNDAVEIMKGENKGQRAAFISLLSAGKDPKHLVELSSGVDIEVFQSEIQAVT